MAVRAFDDDAATTTVDPQGFHGGSRILAISAIFGRAA
jgi:hypothetical protein